MKDIYIRLGIIAFLASGLASAPESVASDCPSIRTGVACGKIFRSCKGGTVAVQSGFRCLSCMVPEEAIEYDRTCGALYEASGELRELAYSVCHANSKEGKPGTDARVLTLKSRTEQTYELAKSCEAKFLESLKIKGSPAQL